MSHFIEGDFGLYQVSTESRHFFISFCREKLKTGNFLPLVSLRNSTREATRLLGGFQLQQGYVAIVFGLSAIPLIRELIEQAKKDGGIIWIFEPDQILVNELRSFFDEDYVQVFSSAQDESFEEIIEFTRIEDFLGYRIFKVPAIEKIAPGYFEEAELVLKQKLSSRLSDLFTRLEFEPVWIRNSLSQLCLFHRASAVRRVFGLLKNQAAALVSTGPGLRELLPWLKKSQDRIFIACVDSAYRVLNRYGIRPHLIFSLDSQPHTRKHFTGLPKGRPGEFPILYADLVANFQVTSRWQGPMLFGITAQYFKENGRVVTPGCDYIEEEILPAINETNLGDIQSGGSVATSLFDLLRQMNVAQILFVGQDLAYSNREIHTMGTHHSDQWFSKTTNRLQSIENINNQVVKKRHVITKAGIGGSRVKADYILSLYHQWFVDAAIRVDIKLVNLNKRGLPIDGVIEQSAADVDLKPNDFSDILSLVSDTKSFISNLNTMQDFLSSFDAKKIEESNLGIFIGRKYEIMKRRAQLRKTDSIDFEQKQKLEKELFLYRLSRRIGSFQHFLVD